jgi:hypothetical protein
MKLGNIFKEVASRLKAARQELTNGSGKRFDSSGQLVRNINEEQIYFADKVKAAAKALTGPKS